ncbi:hypothetical protein PAK_P100049 [Pseudomonas phage PAK_P1]|uniref:Uncharacterized protein n=4 Tax=Pakpunavirus TaxID=1921407 RepID=V5K2W4_9CAUD|nr:hypothetical protein PAK_P100049 [Pseudomonas phage PAK_P1]YP_010763696.1 hypothetical protein QE331_gp140 [Pseudomonas phage 20Sep416]YP_010764984.1 hypothetical protein QE346_gp126 [Pseudomonas phage phipa10]WFG37148.1 hypothetical protein 9081_00033 [Pseudomonas phage bmx-p3]WFG37858.1 hypothetical protein 20Sep418_00183 [Pseudomonas phage 20Sep418]AGS81756.1 hypothetical protein PAK_P100049 [Pseudomonas phage PAK_P1]UGL61602.1 hypothetical protein [Pseudomonas phage phipa10]WFG37667.1
MKRLCYRCMHFGEPTMHRHKTGIWYKGCSKCGSGVFYG